MYTFDDPKEIYLIVNGDSTQYHTTHKIFKNSLLNDVVVESEAKNLAIPLTSYIASRPKVFYKNSIVTINVPGGPVIDYSRQIIQNFNFNNFTSKVAATTSTSVDPDAIKQCSNQYHGDLSNHPQLVGQCQQAHWWGCARDIYLPSYPSKADEFKTRIQTYCKILDDYQAFAEGTFNPKKECRSCDGF